MTFYKIPTVQDSIISVYYILSNGKLQMIGDVAHDYLRELQKAKQLRLKQKGFRKGGLNVILTKLLT